MKNILRSVNTKFWNDTYIMELEPNDKLVFLYLLTNPLTNLAGVYEISIKRIMFDTGLGKEIVLKALKDFERDKKIIYFKDEGYIILVNYSKNQNYNDNMKKNVEETYKALPLQVFRKYNEMVLKPLKAFETLRKSEREIEDEIEDESENEDINISFEKFWNLYDYKKGKDDCEAYWFGNKKIKNGKKINDSDRELIISYIPDYVKATPDKQYRKQPKTFLYNSSWLDEIITDKPIKQNEQKRIPANVI